MQMVVFLQTCINFVEQRLKFSHFEGSIIPFREINFHGCKFYNISRGFNFADGETLTILGKLIAAVAR